MSEKETPAAGRARLFALMRDPALPLPPPPDWAEAPSVTEFLGESLKARRASGPGKALRRALRRLREGG
ncbi:MAG: hypothetical protein GYB53_05300 [Rhodobacteraceae bacterium]|nr:hypothetical protein [Paracoccaceae bacterium]MBR9822071.1 hypothetical protein [Paracoccaceae bacterium]